MIFSGSDSLHKPNHLLLVTGVSCIALLAILIGISPKHLCYDEPYHLGLAEAVGKSGLQAALTAPDNQSAAGPLFPIIHSTLSSVTKLAAPSVRWVNFICLILVIGMISFTLRNEVSNHPWAGSIGILAVPFLWPAAGMALTEMPALLAFTGFLFCFSHILTSKEKEISRKSITWAALAGAALGVSILGRQTYLIILPAVAVLVYTVPQKRILWCLCLLITGITCGWLFLLWGGLLPPSQSVVGEGLRFDHGILSLSYVAAATLFINPRWMKPGSLSSVIILSAIAVVVAWLTRDYSSPPAKSLLLRFFSEPLARAIGFCIGTFLTGAGLLWGWSAIQKVWHDRFDPWRTFLHLTLLALVAAPVKVSHLFSSRYVVGALGVLVLVTTPSGRDRWIAARLFLGSSLGGALLWTYYQA